MEAVKNKLSQYKRSLASKSKSQIEETLAKTNSNKRNVQLTIQESKEVIEIPIEALSFLKDILSMMAEGNDFTIIESDSEMTTQEAANILNVSRPYLVKLLETGKIPFKKAGTHRRILVKDIIKYQSKQQNDRRKNLNLLARQAQELNLGY